MYVYIYIYMPRFRGFPELSDIAQMFTQKPTGRPLYFGRDRGGQAKVELQQKRKKGEERREKKVQSEGDQVRQRADFERDGGERLSIIKLRHFKGLLNLIRIFFLRDISFCLLGSHTWVGGVESREVMERVS
jgi:hypothetical protein